jgi:hypothetical protein
MRAARAQRGRPVRQDRHTWDAWAKRQFLRVGSRMLPYYNDSRNHRYHPPHPYQLRDYVADGPASTDTTWTPEGA